MNKPNVLVSFSGGPSSGLMAYLLKTTMSDKYNFVFVFANTSRESEETLIFVDKVDKWLGLNLVWVEAVVWHGIRKSCTHKIVNFETACRDKGVFEEVIKKYGIPNNKFKHCTRETKTNPIKSYAASIGLTDYISAIGYRADEPNRLDWEKAKREKQWYPLAEGQIRKADVANFWSQKGFRLNLKSYQGNCTLCYKKSKRKLKTIINENSLETQNEIKWLRSMEEKYGSYTPETHKESKPPYRFFRENDSIDDIIEEAQLPFEAATDDYINSGGYQASLYSLEEDSQTECSESCEPF